MKTTRSAWPSSICFVERRTLLAQMAPELESLLTAKNDRVSRHAAFLLGMSGPDAARRLFGAPAHESSRIDQIAEALAQIGRPAVGLLIQAVKSTDPRVRRGRPWRWDRFVPWLRGRFPS